MGLGSVLLHELHHDWPGGGWLHAPLFAGWQVSCSLACALHGERACSANALVLSAAKLYICTVLKPVTLAHSGPDMNLKPLVVERPHSPGAVETVHPALWRAHQMGGQREAAVPTGFAALNAQLPGAGWPRKALTELLLPHLGVGEMRLLAPALAAVARGEGARSIMLFGPPAKLCGWGLAQLGVPAAQLLLVQGREGQRRHARFLPQPDVLWALEQALKSGEVGAVLAWLPEPTRAQALRRLQLAAQSHEGPVFLLRDESARHQPSPAPLRLALSVAGMDALAVRVLKRRGPACTTTLQLSLPAVLPPVLRERWQRAQQLPALAATATLEPLAS